jgi:hemolysin D
LRWNVWRRGPGCAPSCNIKVGRRSILEYVLNPITRVIDESPREP